MKMLRTELGRLRLVNALEGLSYLLLVGVAMPLKYLAGNPEAVHMLGRVHGLLFVLFIVAMVPVASTQRWSPKHTAEVLGASLVPLGALLLERWLKREQAAPRPKPADTQAL